MFETAVQEKRSGILWGISTASAAQLMMYSAPATL